MPDGAGGYTLFDSCTERLVRWMPVATATSAKTTDSEWRSTHHPGARLVRLASGYFELQWGNNSTEMVETRHADGRLLQQSKAATVADRPVTVDYEWSDASPLTPQRLIAMRHSDGTVLKFEWDASSGRLSALRFNDQVIRTYRYNDAGWLMAARDDPDSSMSWQYRYTVKGDLLA